MAKIQIHLSTAQLEGNIYHFNYTNYYLFNANLQVSVKYTIHFLGYKTLKS